MSQREFENHNLGDLKHFKPTLTFFANQIEKRTNLNFSSFYPNFVFPPFVDNTLSETNLDLSVCQIVFDYFILHIIDWNEIGLSCNSQPDMDNDNCNTGSSSI